MSCSCSKLAFRSVSASESSANAGSSESSGNGSLGPRSLEKDPRETRRSGVVGPCRRAEGWDWRSEDWRMGSGAGGACSGAAAAAIIVGGRGADGVACSSVYSPRHNYSA